MLTSTPHEDFRWLLERELLDRVPKTHYALVASSDGMARYFCGLTKDQADGLAAMATPLLSVVAAMAQNGGHSQTVHQVMAELDDVIFYVCAAGLNGVLAVAADRSVEPGLLVHKMRELATKVPAQLGTPPRMPDDDGSHQC